MSFESAESVRPLGRSGLNVGPLSFGAAPIANLGRAVDEATAIAAVDAAWDAGIRYFDVAPHYGLGLGERRLGRALARRPRDEYIISTKVGRLLVDDGIGVRDDPEGFAVASSLTRLRDYSRDGVLRCLDESLGRLGLDRIDIVFVHDPDEYGRDALEHAFPALDDLRRQRVIRSYGAGMNQSAMLTEFVISTDLDVVMCAGRYTLLDQSALDDLLPAVQSRRVSVVAAAVFNSGILARRRPAADATFGYLPAAPQTVSRVNAIADVCDRYDVSLPAAALQFAPGSTAVATVCIGARSAKQIAENARLMREKIPSGLWTELISRGLIRQDAPVPAG